MNDYFFINEAYKEAIKASKKNDVPVGCVVVYKNKIIARAHNLRESKKNVLCHAEIIAINKACKKLKMKFLDDCIIYITLEPCIMCAGAIIQARIKRIVYGANEPKFGCLESVGNIFESFKFNHKVEVTSGLMKDDISELMKNFFKALRKKNK